VTVEEIGTLVLVAGEMDLDHAVARQTGEVGVRIEPVVVGAHLDVVHVEQDPAIGSLRDRGEELPLGHGGVAVGDVRRDVLERDLAPEDILNADHSLDDVRERLLGVGERPEVVDVMAAVPSPAQVIGHERRLDSVDEPPQVREVPLVDGLGRPDRQRDTVEDHGQIAAHLLQHRIRPPAEPEIVFARGLDPVDAGTFREPAAEVLGSQADAMPQRRTRDGHQARRVGDGGAGPSLLHIGFICSTLPPFSRHSFSVSSAKLFPLQAFWPLQSFLALLQLPFPLQSFTPTHLTVFSPVFPSFSPAYVTPLARRLPTALATAAPNRALRSIMFVSQSSFVLATAVTPITQIATAPWSNTWEHALRGSMRSGYSPRLGSGEGVTPRAARPYARS
jgi:hypothetical protein